MHDHDDFDDVERHKMRRKIVSLAHGLPGLLWYEYVLAAAASLPVAAILLLTEPTMTWLSVLVGGATILGLVQLRRLWHGRREYVVLWLRKHQLRDTSEGRRVLRILDRDAKSRALRGQP